MKATYRDVCSHNICHVKAVQVEFDPNEISNEDLLMCFG
jgi:peptide methionine sulfoxide reductase MsrA